MSCFFPFNKVLLIAFPTFSVLKPLLPLLWQCDFYEQLGRSLSFSHLFVDSNSPNSPFLLNKIAGQK